MTTRLLLVDGDLDNKIFAEYFAGLDIDIDFASTGVEACAKALETDYHMIILAIAMPDMRGIDAARFLRDNLRQDKPVKLVASTANPIITRKGRAQLDAAGFDEVFIKPYTQDRLVRLTTSLLGDS